MKLITRCTQCHTSFRVHDQQLAVRQGRVRCGACGHVFDAYSTLTEQPEAERAAHPGEWQVPAGAPPHAEPAGARAFSYDDPISLAEPIFDVGSARTPESAPIRAIEARADDARLELDPRALDVAPSARTSFSPGDLMLSSPADLRALTADAGTAEGQGGQESRASDPSSYSIADPLPIGQVPSEPHVAPAPVPEVLEDDFDFGPRRASRKARVWMSLAAGVLVVIALGQLAFATRSYIAAWAPNTRPIIEELCTQLGCDVPHLRRSEVVMLDSSELEREEAGLLTLHAVIRNTSVFEQALPSLMLTLLDDRSRAIARRIVDAKDYVPESAPGTQVLPASGTVQATVYIDAAKLGQTAATYEVMVFYR